MLVYAIVFLPFLAAGIAYPLGRRHERTRDVFVPAFALLIFILTILLFWQRGSGPSLSGVLSMGLSFTVDGFRTVYAVITSFMWLLTSVFSREYFQYEREGLAHYYVFWLMTLGATEGVMLSADLMTTFVFFEILSFTSFTWVLHEQTRKAIRAGYTYLFIAVIGGLLLLMGLLLLYSATGTLAFAELPAAMARVPANASSRLFPAGILILLGFGAKAGMFPLHVWLPKAHPVAPSPGSALLSGVLTKVGIYGILMTSLEAFPRHPMLGATIYVLGLVTMFLGALLALFSVNLKRTLACSSMSQVGFILTGLGSFILQEALAAGEELANVSEAAESLAQASTGTLSVLHEVSGEGSVLASSGLMLHMVNHSLLKLLLFMIAGVVVMNLHQLNLNNIRGWGRKKPLLKVAFALGGLGISGVPLFNGYISKTMLHEGIVMLIERAEEIIPANGFALGFFAASEWIFLISGGLTFAYMLKLFICIFVEKNSNPRVQARYDGVKLSHRPANGFSNLAARHAFASTRFQAASRYSREKAAAEFASVISATPAEQEAHARSVAPKRYMNRLSAFVILLSALFMVILGQPAVMNRLAAFMTGNPEILEFQAFTLGNLKGGAISLAIGAAVYLFVVRALLMRPRKTAEDIYYNRRNSSQETMTGQKTADSGKRKTKIAASKAVDSGKKTEEVTADFGKKSEEISADSWKKNKEIAAATAANSGSEKAEVTADHRKKNKEIAAAAALNSRRKKADIATATATNAGEENPEMAAATSTGTELKQFAARFFHAGGEYVNRWPKGLDVEERVYRPLLTKVLPGIFGTIMRVPAENLVTKQLCRGILALGKAIAHVFGENLLLIPLAKVILFMGTFLGRCLATGTDALFALLRATILRERKVRTAEERAPGKLRTAAHVTGDALRPITLNFSFALIMTCLGILVFLGVLLWTLLGM